MIDKELLDIENRLALVEITILNVLAEERKVTGVTEVTDVIEESSDIPNEGEGSSSEEANLTNLPESTE